MLYLADFRLDYNEIIKALGEAPMPTGPTPTGEEHKPRTGHKYVKRWWSGAGWQYEYANEGKAHHPMHFGEESDKTRAHVLELPQGHQFGHGQEQEAYHSTLQAHKKPNVVHQVPHPSGQGTINVTHNEKGQPHVEGHEKPFNSHGNYEQWYRTQRLGPVEHIGPGGKPWAIVSPLVGTVNRETGELTPRKPPSLGQSAKDWGIFWHPNVDPEVVAKLPGGEQAFRNRYYPTAAHAVKFLEKQKRNIELTTPQTAGGTATTPTAATIDHPDPLIREMSQHGWRNVEGEPEPGKRKRTATAREFAGDDETKDTIVNKVASQYSPAIASAVLEGINRHEGMKKNPDYWLEHFGLNPRAAYQGIKQNTPIPLHAEKDKAVHMGLSHMINNVDPQEQYKKEGTTGGLRNLDSYFQQYARPRIVEEVIAEGSRQQRMQQQQKEEGGGGFAELEPHTLPQSKTSRGTQKPVAEASALEGGTYDPEGSATSLHKWRSMQNDTLDKLTMSEDPFQRQFAKQAMKYLGRVATNEDVEHFMDTMNKFGFNEHVVNKSMIVALLALHNEFKKAQTDPNQLLTRDTKVDPTHQYSHREGSEYTPKFYYKDPNGNYLRYTNAPTDHEDQMSRFGDASLHSTEPDSNKNPEFFDLKGRKLSRSPYPNTDVQWNPNYHAQDNQNLWAGRWVNPNSNEHEYTYLDSDMKTNPQLYMHQQCILIDMRLPTLREYIRKLFSSPMLKDKITATALTLIDQGHFTPEDLSTLSVEDLQDYGSVIKLGNRYIYPDNKLKSMLSFISKDRNPNEPLFAVPYTNGKGEIDPTLIRRIGPHYLECTLDALGIDVQALQVYHASQSFSREVNRLVSEHSVDFNTATEYAMYTVAQELGYDLTHEPQASAVLSMLKDLLISQIMSSVLKDSVAKLPNHQPAMLPLPAPAIIPVTLGLVNRTSDEDEYSKWLHSVAPHQYISNPEMSDQQVAA